MSPEIEVAADELTTLIDPYRFWVAGLATNPFKRMNDIFTAIPKPHIRRWTVM